MTNRTKKKALWLAQEGSYGVDPSSNGSLYAPVKTETLAFPQDTLQLLASNFSTDRNRQTAFDAGPDGASLEVSMPFQGLSVAAGIGQDPPAVDPWDMILASAFATISTYTGAAVTAGGTSSVTVPGLAAAVQDLLAIGGAGGVNDGALQWRRAGALAANVYSSLDRDFDAAPTAACTAFGIRQFQPADTQGSSLAAYVDVDGAGYTLLGGRPTALKITGQAGQKWMLSTTLKFDSMAIGTKGSIPVFGLQPGTPLKALSSPVAWGNTVFATKGVTLDFGITASDQMSTQGAQGRANIEVLSAFPKITLEPMYASSWVTDFRAGTTRSIAIQFGSGVAAGGGFFFAESAQVRGGAQPADDGGRIRQNINLEVVDAGIFSGSAIARHWTFARA